MPSEPPLSHFDVDRPLVFYVNGKKIVENNVDPETTLLQYLRNKLCLRGTKLGCNEGGCGACTVMISKYEGSPAALTHCAINACLAPLCSLHGVAITTVEGIGSTKTKLHDIQDRLAKTHGTQCGFCTPGFVMSMYALLRTNPQPTEQDIETAFQGNLCRCTGYRPILEGFRSFVKSDGMQQNGACALGEKCCRKTGVTCSKQQNDQQEPDRNNESKEDVVQLCPCDPTQEPIFPSELQLNAKEFDSTPLLFKSDRVTWYRPTQLTDLLQLKDKYPSAKLIIGNTETGLEARSKNIVFPVLIAATHISELNSVQHTNVSIRFGASVTLTTVQNTLKQAIGKLNESKTRVFTAFAEMLHWFGSPQIRNTASIGGNIITARRMGDINPLLLAAGATLTLASHDGGQRQVKMDDKFFTGYRQTLLKPNEILLYIDIPFSNEDEYFAGYKQCPRREDDISIVNAGMRVVFEQGQTTVKDITLAFGGMAPTTVMASKAASQLVGKKWDDDMVSLASKLLLDELPVPAGFRGGMEAYRCSLAVSFFFKFYLTVRLRIEQITPSLYPAAIPANYRSACDAYDRPPSSGVQVFEQVGDGQPEVDAVGRPIPHLSSEKHTTGEAVYVDDMPKFEGELHLGLVLSTKAHARLLNVDPTDALSMSGVVDFVSHKDIPGSNAYGLFVPNEEVIFATDTVTCQGQVIGAIVAETKEQAQRAAKAVKITYEELEPIITMDQAIAANSFLCPDMTLNKGDTTAALAAADHVIDGGIHIGGQEHFYLETQACIAVPKPEDGEMEFFCSTQSLSFAQKFVALALGVNANKILCHARRLGGAFGGKATRWSISGLPTVVAARKCGRPVRCMLDRDEDMMITGTRHPMMGKYKIGFNKDGKIVAAEIELWFNAGHTRDTSPEVQLRAVFNAEGCYFIPNLRVIGHICKTNIPSNTAMRAFGCPQPLLMIETAVHDVATVLNMDPAEVRRQNLYKDGDTTHYNQTLVDVTLGRCWTQILTQADYEHRKQDVDKFNSENRWKKRGIVVQPVKHTIGNEPYDFLNQAGALVHILTDGTVQISLGGVEFGQGLHTKMIQVASRVLNLPVSQIHISDVNTDTVANTTTTGGSCSSDIYGMAVMEACQTLMDRLKPFMEANPPAGWNMWILMAYMSRVSLSATGFHRVPANTYDMATNSGDIFNYFTFGVACTEVEIDCLTGDHQIIQTDIVMDVGKSLNPGIDVGQIEGAFMQGYGLYCLEEHKFSAGGQLLTRGPSNYKIPSCASIPIKFNVTLLKDAANPKAVYSSKGIGEPPYGLGVSVYLAIKSAIIAARKDAGLSGPFRLDSPATPERIRMACVDHITKQVPSYEAGTYKPWYVNV